MLPQMQRLRFAGSVPEIKYVRVDRNQGVGGARNIGRCRPGSITFLMMMTASARFADQQIKFQSDQEMMIYARVARRC